MLLCYWLLAHSCSVFSQPFPFLCPRTLGFTAVTELHSCLGTFRSCRFRLDSQRSVHFIERGRDFNHPPAPAHLAKESVSPPQLCNKQTDYRWGMGWGGKNTNTCRWKYSTVLLTLVQVRIFWHLGCASLVRERLYLSILYHLKYCGHLHSVLLFLHK